MLNITVLNSFISYCNSRGMGSGWMIHKKNVGHNEWSVKTDNKTDK